MSRSVLNCPIRNVTAIACQGYGAVFWLFFLPILQYIFSLRTAKYWRLYICYWFIIYQCLEKFRKLLFRRSPIIKKCKNYLILY